MVTTLYHRISGGSVERLAALSDGIFSVSMTLLVLELHVPVVDVYHGQRALWRDGAVDAEKALWHALVHLAPNLVVYFLSFLTLGMFWVGQQTQLNHFTRSNRHLTWIHLAFLLMVALMPFTTALLANYITLRLALGIYWLHLLLLGVLLLFSLRYADTAGLITESAAGPGVRQAA